MSSPGVEQFGEADELLRFRVVTSTNRQSSLDAGPTGSSGYCGHGLPAAVAERTPLQWLAGSGGAGGGGGDLEWDGERDGLLVVEQQRQQSR
jgi:hypothetical protein